MTTPRGKQPSPIVQIEITEQLCPRYISDSILDEVRHYFKTPIPASLAQDLADHAEWGVMHHPHLDKLVKGREARAWIKKYMRRWLAAFQQKEHPIWYRHLPKPFKLARLQPPPSRHMPSKSIVKVP